ncbi:anti-sigma factor antagonist [Chamaesiphon minutus]|uniref:Anti-sigma factor antagonist n=1 Tax=Chamaesiphon minutus (strain ATCC 27169 / PCC 6605) TaxID=1173020 RepID=K9UCH1_CHAP6|nr:anti-sigma factor antagonist [Chamaesiphon minutus]AFY92146.1 anti-anti-sigma factor [Chamaesiphon minutus PCC 6605]
MTTILAIEDEAKILENIQEILELEGFDVLIAENGRIGVQLAREHHPDLIICDVMMPELDGYDVLITLRQDPNTLKIPFIFLSARATKADFRKGMSLGADDYLTKPFTPGELREAISTRLEKQTMMITRYAQELERAMGSSLETVTYSQNMATETVNCVAAPVKVIQPNGVLDVTNCSQLRREIVETANAGFSNVLVDCQNLTFMDSSGLAALVLASQKVRETNSRLSICSINQQIEMLFELSSMYDIFETFPSSTEFYSNYNISN